MATVEELVEQYQTDEDLQKEVADILADGKISISEFFNFVRAHDVDISITELPNYVKQAKELGFLG